MSAGKSEMTVTLSRRELIGLTGGGNSVESYDAPPELGPVSYALATLTSCAGDLRVALHHDEVDEEIAMTLLRMAYRMEAVESFVRRELKTAKAEPAAAPEAASESRIKAGGAS